MYVARLLPNVFPIVCDNDIDRDDMAKLTSKAKGTIYDMFILNFDKFVSIEKTTGMEETLRDFSKNLVDQIISEHTKINTRG